MRKPVDDEKRLKIRNFRMSDSDWELLQAYFEEKRVSTATGIRMVLMETLKRDKFIK
jgi:hypothetical protein